MFNFIATRRFKLRKQNKNIFYLLKPLDNARNLSNMIFSVIFFDLKAFNNVHVVLRTDVTLSRNGQIVFRIPQLWYIVCSGESTSPTVTSSEHGRLVQDPIQHTLVNSGYLGWSLDQFMGHFGPKNGAFPPYIDHLLKLF